MNFDRLIIADDFGIDEMNDEVMLNLCFAEKINGVSLFSNFITQSSVDKLLIARKQTGTKIGMHFNLTLDADKKQITKVHILLLKSMLGLIDKKLVAESFESQLIQFKEKFMFYPDFIDGHEHVHAFPIIRKIICNRLSKMDYSGFVRYVGSKSSKILLRSLKYQFFLKFLTLEMIAINQKKELIKNKLDFNGIFDGLVPHGKSSQLIEILKKVHAAEESKSLLIMCHPGVRREGMSNNFFFNKDREIEKNLLLDQ